MTDNDYVAELRSYGGRVTNEAADRIEALTTQRAEDADVRTQIDHRLEELVGQVDALTAERDALQADNARLRDALKEQIHIRQNCHLMPCAAPGNDSCQCETKYRTALNTAKKTK
jgi:chromosome segregation ATPase